MAVIRTNCLGGLPSKKAGAWPGPPRVRVPEDVGLIDNHQGVVVGAITEVPLVAAEVPVVQQLLVGHVLDVELVVCRETRAHMPSRRAAGEIKSTLCRRSCTASRMSSPATNVLPNPTPSANKTPLYFLRIRLGPRDTIGLEGCQAVYRFVPLLVFQLGAYNSQSTRR